MPAIEPGYGRNALLLAIGLSLGAGVAAAIPQRAEGPVELAFSEYLAGDAEAISRIIPTTYFVGSGARKLRQEIDAAILRWGRERRAVLAAFLLEVAHFGLASHGGRDALDVLAKARSFVTDRIDPPGQNPKDDEFEIAWHKTAVALLGSLRQPDVLERIGIAPLGQRMSASPPPRGEPRLVDPWIELARALVEEQRTMADPGSLIRQAPAAIHRLEQAAKYDGNLPEAMVRECWLFVRLGRYDEALSALDTVGDWTEVGDTTVRYWSWLFRGRALEGLGRAEEAARAYREALAIVPHAQTPAAALAALETQRGNHDAAASWAAQGRSAPADAVDPWMSYGSGEHRFFEERLERLRELSR
ncbi:MAG TPA: tetratricopeptide repeat protein [Vicinamibacterales bacterium]|nr:tetratricopeptide repeat protein [Vicinamibacterales bacterium]